MSVPSESEIAAIATRLYNGIPGANMVPKHEAEMPPSPQSFGQLPMEPSGVPSVPHAPALGGMFPSLPTQPSGEANVFNAIVAAAQRVGQRTPNSSGVPSPQLAVPSEGGAVPAAGVPAAPPGYPTPSAPAIPGAPAFPTGYGDSGSHPIPYASSVPTARAIPGAHSLPSSPTAPGSHAFPGHQAVPSGASSTDLQAMPSGFSIPRPPTVPGGFAAPGAQAMPSGYSIPRSPTAPSGFAFPGAQAVPHGYADPGSQAVPANYGVPAEPALAPLQPPTTVFPYSGAPTFPGNDATSFGYPAAAPSAPPGNGGPLTPQPFAYSQPHPVDRASGERHQYAHPSVASGSVTAQAAPTSGAVPTSTNSAVPTSTYADDRPASKDLRSFIQTVRSSDYRSEDALCANNSRRRPTPAPVETTGDQRPPHKGFRENSTLMIGARPFDVNEIRKDFPVLHQLIHGKPLVWFDNAATTQKPQSVIDAISRFYERDNSNIHRGAHTLAARATDAYEQARQKVRAFLGAGSPNEIIFVRGTTEGINLISKTYGRKFLQPGDEVVISTIEHHANIVPWQMVTKETGAILRVIPVNDRGEIIMEEYQKLLGPRTRIVALAHAANALGTILPVAEMTKLAKRYNARVLIDGAQSVAHLPVNVQQLDCDFYVFSGHKIFGPTGIGAVYAKKEVQEIMPPWQGGGNMIKNVTFEETTYSDPPAKFEAGTPNIADAVGLGAALDYVNRLGLANIAAYEHQLLEYGTERLSRINGLTLIGTAKEKVGVLSFVLANRKTEEVGRMLDQEGIAVRSGHHCAQPSLRRCGVETTVRPSFSLYNTFEEIDRLAEAVKRIARN